MVAKDKLKARYFDISTSNSNSYVVEDMGGYSEQLGNWLFEFNIFKFFIKQKLQRFVLNSTLAQLSFPESTLSLRKDSFHGVAFYHLFFFVQYIHYLWISKNIFL